MQNDKVLMKRKKFAGDWDNPLKTTTDKERKQINDAIERAYKKRRNSL